MIFEYRSIANFYLISREEQTDCSLMLYLTSEYVFENFGEARASAEIFPGSIVENLLIFFRLLTMQCKWTFTKRFTISTPLVCVG